MDNKDSVITKCSDKIAELELMRRVLTGEEKDFTTLFEVNAGTLTIATLESGLVLRADMGVDYGRDRTLIMTCGDAAVSRPFQWRLPDLIQVKMALLNHPLVLCMYRELRKQYQVILEKA